MFCYKCGIEIPDDSNFCRECGARPVGTLVPAPAHGCPRCGGKMIDTELLGHKIEVRRARKLTLKTLFQYFQRSAVDAKLCGDCGFIEFYARFPGDFEA
ncbi:MAG: zinc ribbon domain-containing protein [Armatimonadetes bacterium]|nr:zinc ribbon domain-containing protein [Armatimonadota bacterium]